MTWRAFYAAGLTVIVSRATAQYCQDLGGCGFVSAGLLQYYEVRTYMGLVDPTDCCIGQCPRHYCLGPIFRVLCSTNIFW